MKSNNRYAFTLAEVLITLGIIGVVAAMTLPTLIQRYKKHVVETRLAKFYSVINQAVKLAEVNYGEASNWEPWEIQYEKDEDGNDTSTRTVSADFFDKYFRPYLNASKIEVNNVSKRHIVYFSDGSLAAFDPESILFWPEAKNYKGFQEDDEGNLLKDTEHSGITWFTFAFAPWEKRVPELYKKGVESYANTAFEITATSLWNNRHIGCKENALNERAFCTRIIQLNGWKIPDNYPFKF